MMYLASPSSPIRGQLFPLSGRGKASYFPPVVCIVTFLLCSPFPFPFSRSVAVGALSLHVISFFLCPFRDVLISLVFQLIRLLFLFRGICVIS